MLRARLPLAVALLAATVVIPATAASAGSNTPADPTGVAKEVTSQTQSNSDPSANSNTAPSDPSTAGTNSNPGATGTAPGGSSGGGGSSSLDTSNNSPSSSQLTGGFQQLQDAASQFQQQLQSSGSSGSSPDIAGALQTFGSCMQAAGSSKTPFLDGQVCIENLIAAITNDPRAHCFSQNNFTLQFLLNRLQSAQPPTQADAEQFQKNLTGLIACLSPSSSSAPAESGGGGAQAADTAAPAPQPTSNEAPAATAVTGTPNFTG